MQAKVSDGARASPPPASGGRVEQSIALIDYDALNEDEISFRAGDVINVTGKGTASGFWEGYVAVPTFPAMTNVGASSDTEREGPFPSAPPSPAPLHGLFPNCLVTSNMRFKSTAANHVFQNIALCLYAYQGSGEGEMSFEPGDVITALRPSASPGWWYGVRNSETPWTAPTARSDSDMASSSRFVDPVSGSLPPPVNAAAEQLFPTNFVTCDVVLIAFHFAGRQAHELSCRSGDVVQVHRRWNDGWWEGSLRGRRGIFPSNYSVPNICTTSPPFFCARCRSLYASNTCQTACATCAREEEVEDAMLKSLEAYVRGDVSTYDLFAAVEVGPLDDSAGVEPRASSAAADGLLASARGAASARSSLRDSISEEERARCGLMPSQSGRATLLTDKDRADLASNRVKLME